MVPPPEARDIVNAGRVFSELEVRLAFTAAVRGEQRDAVLRRHRPSEDHPPGSRPYCVGCWEAGGFNGAALYPCSTALDLGVEDV
jgi:hypothetical protein